MSAAKIYSSAPARSPPTVHPVKRSMPAFVLVIVVGLLIGAALAGPPSTPEHDIKLSPTAIVTTVPGAP